MKRNRKHLLACLLCIVLALSTVFASCQEATDTSEASDQSTTSTSGETSNEIITTPGWDNELGRWVADLDTSKYDGRTFTVLVMGSTYGTYSSREFGFSEDDVLQSEVINDAAKRKIDYIKSTYGVDIVPVYASKTTSNDIGTLINDDIRTGTGEYDAVMPYLTYLSSLASEGKLLDLSKYNEYIDFTKPWWDYSSVSDLAIHGKVFFAVGDITLLNKVCTTAIVFNKEVINDLGLTSPYKLVRDNEWTFDKMVEMGRKYAADANGDGILTYDDHWGLSTAYNDINNYYIASGQHLAVLNSDKEPELALNSQEAINTIQKLLAELNDRSWCIYAQEMEVQDIWDMSLRVLGEGRAMFRTSGFSAVEKLKSNYDFDYGIVPMPKISDSQPYYLSVSTSSTVSGIGMTIATKDPEFAAYMIEVNAVEGRNYLTPAYYDKVLKGQGATDIESREMLDLVFEHTTYDLGRTYNFGNMYDILGDLVANKSDNIVSKIAENKSLINQAIDKVISAYNNTD